MTTPQAMHHATSEALPPGRWWPPNHATCEAFVRHVRTQPAGTLCVFDWDNTCVFDDIGDVAFAWQLHRARLQHTPAQLQALWQPIAAQALALAKTPAQRDHAGRAAAWLSDALAAFEHLRAHGDDSVEPDSPARLHFRAGMMMAMRALAQSEEPTLVADTFAAAAQIWCSQKGDPLRADMDALLAFQASSSTRGRWQWPATSTAPAIDTPVPLPAVVMEEMRALVSALTQAGATVAIVTASPEPMVRALSQRWGFAVHPTHVIGMPTQDMIAQRPQAARTFRCGKVEAIAQRLEQTPLFAAGDAMTDYEMLTSYPSMRLRLLIERPPLPPMLQALASHARRELVPPSFSSSPLVTLVQARDPHQHAWLPTRPISLH